MTGERKKGGRNIVNIETNNLVQCTFRTSYYNKQRLIDLAEERGQTLSETLSDLLTSKFEFSDYKKKFDNVAREFIKTLAKNDDKKYYEYIDIYKEILKKEK